MSRESTPLFSNIKSDLPASIVVFLIAVPLCLGIALASGAPLFSGMIAGIVGGLVIGSFSKSQLSVSGPAAGLTAIVLAGITKLGAFDIFLLAVVIAGVIQLILGFLKAGSVAYYFPGNVIKGMLTGIGIIIILKQIPHAFGYDKDAEGNLAFFQIDGDNSFSAIINSVNYIHPGAVIIALLSILILVYWPKIKKFKIVPAPLVAVIVSILVNEIFKSTGNPFLSIKNEHLVNLPVAKDVESFIGQFTLPDFSAIMNKEVWILAFTLAIVASIETLLTIEATDKLDPHKRTTPTNRELKAQGFGNMISGLIGGLPMTSVIVRSTANINSGGQTKLSTILHGAFLLLFTILIPNVLNMIPLATLAAILIMTGYKLCNPAVFKDMFSKGKYQWVPFVVTVIAIVLTDLLVGVSIGLAVSIVFILRGNLKSPYFFNMGKYQQGDLIRLELAQEVSFLNKASIRLTLEAIPKNSTVVIDASKTVYIDYDVLEIIREFEKIIAPEKNIKLVLTGFKEEYKISNTDHTFYKHEDKVTEPQNNSVRPYHELFKQLKIN